MKRYIFAILLLFLLIPYSEAQLWRRKRYEIVLGVGPSQFFGDVGGFSQGENWAGLKDLSFSGSSFNVNLGIDYRVTKQFTTRLNMTYGMLRASDLRGSNTDRGFVAITSIAEPSLLGQYYFSRHRSERSFLLSRRKPGVFGGFFKSLDFYAFTGVGGLYYNVKPNAALEPRVTVTDGITAVIPVGIGGSIIYTPNLTFGFEFGGRYAFTDNLDGYTSQYSNSNDVYYFLNFTIGFRLKNTANGWPSFR
jgi:hypothetical protein